MTDRQDVRLTSGEVGHIWERYMNNSLSSVLLGYLVHKIEADDIRDICSFALMTVETELNRLKQLYQEQKFSMPNGFDQTDMNPNAPKPVTDEFVLFYLHDMAKMDLNLTSIALADAAREDMRQLYRESMAKAMELHERSSQLLLEKGLFLRSPLVTATEEAQEMAEGGFLSTWFGSDPRTLTAREAHELHKNVMLNYHGKCLMIVFHQTNSNPQLKNLLMRGKELASHIMKLLSDQLIENDLPVTMTWDTHVLDSTEPPFSDRLICFLVDQMNKFGIASYGYAAAVSARKDLKLLYGRIIADVYQYETDLKNFMIKNKWLERPPAALDRRKLSEV